MPAPSLHSSPIVLIVDDIATNVQILAEGLKADYRIRIATNGVDALTLARTAPQPDLILLDIMMPELDGFAVCRQLKQDPLTRAIPVIFVTAKDNIADEEMGLNLGAVDYITKPFHLPIVRARVHNHIMLKRHADMLEALSMIDPLTHIPNRRRLDDALPIMWARAIQEHTPLSVLMLDIDYFKEYNDHFGYRSGDQCLRSVALTLLRALPTSEDLIARYSGGAFVVLLPRADAALAQQVAERLRQSVASLRMSHPQSPAETHVTLSVGIATLHTAEPTHSAQHLLDAADAALHRAKQQGHNCIHALTL